MEQRVHRRFPRRLEVRFWRKGETQSHSGFTTNLSRTGLFLASGASFVPGERLRLEIADGDESFMIEGQVARVHRVSLALRHVAQPGVGVRFLPPDELVELLLPPTARQAGPVSAAPPSPVRIEGSPAPPPAVPVGSPSPAGREPNGGAAPVAEIARLVPVTFTDASAFLSVFHRDIQSGGLFVSTAEPGAINDVVTIELHLPVDGERAPILPARVVQRYEPEAAIGEGRNLLGGMAVQFLEPDKVVERLRPLVAKLRR